MVGKESAVRKKDIYRVIGRATAIGVAVMVFWELYKKHKECKMLRLSQQNTEAKLRCLREMIRLSEKNINIADYFVKHEYNRVIIYGMGILGQPLLSQLNGMVEVVCAIDRRKINDVSIPVIGINDEIPEADVIVITAVSEIDQIKEQLEKVTDCRIVTIKEVILDSYYF